MNDAGRKMIFLIGGIAALLTVAVAFAEMLITFLPGGNETVETVYEWFALLQSNAFMGLRNLGLLNIFMVSLGIPLYFALYTAHSNANKTFAGLALSISFISVAVFFATNRAFAMLDLSHQYAQAAVEAQRAVYAAAGQAMLSVGRSHSPGTFMAFFLAEVGGIFMSVVLLQGKIFSRVTALAGIAGFSLLLIFEICTTFIPALRSAAMLFAVGGGILNIAWMVMVGQRFLKLARVKEMSRSAAPAY